MACLSCGKDCDLQYCRACYNQKHNMELTVCKSCEITLCMRTFCDKCWVNYTTVCGGCSNWTMSELCGKCHEKKQKLCETCGVVPVSANYQCCYDCRTQKNSTMCMACSNHVGVGYEYCFECNDAYSVGLERCKTSGCVTFCQMPYCEKCMLVHVSHEKNQGSGQSEHESTQAGQKGGHQSGQDEQKTGPKSGQRDDQSGQDEQKTGPKSGQRDDQSGQSGQCGQSGQSGQSGHSDEKDQSGQNGQSGQSGQKDQSDRDARDPSIADGSRIETKQPDKTRLFVLTIPATTKLIHDLVELLKTHDIECVQVTPL